MSADVSIVIVSYNSREHLPACLESLRAQQPAAPAEVIVVDNASADGSAALLSNEYPWVRLVARATNRGFAFGVNDGVAASTGRHLALVNPDTRVNPDVIARLSAFLDANPDAGIAAPKLLNDDGTLQLSCRAFPGHATALFNRYSLLTKLLPGNRYSRDYLMADFDHASRRDVDWLSGAVMMFPRTVFDRVGGWDAGFFMFNEDVDFCRRVHDAGLRVVYEPAVTVYHTIGASKSASPRMIVTRHRSMWRYYRKHLRGNIALDAVTAAGITARCGLLLAGSLAASALRRAK